MKHRQFFKPWGRLKKACQKVSGLIGAMSLMLYVNLAQAASGTDPLAGVIESNITPVLGSDSTFFKIMCLAEIIGAVAAYWKTKSYGMLAGVIFVALFFDVAYTHYVG